MKKLFLTLSMASVFFSSSGYTSIQEIDGYAFASKQMSLAQIPQEWKNCKVLSVKLPADKPCDTWDPSLDKIVRTYPEEKILDPKELGKRVAPLVMKNSGLNIDTLDVSGNSWKPQAIEDFLTELSVTRSLKKSGNGRFNGTFEEYKKYRNDEYFSTYREYNALSDNDWEAEYLITSGQDKVVVKNELTLKNIDLSYNQLFEENDPIKIIIDPRTGRNTNVANKTISTRKSIGKILFEQNFESINLTCNYMCKENLFHANRIDLQLRTLLRVLHDSNNNLYAPLESSKDNIRFEICDSVKFGIFDGFPFCKEKPLQLKNLNLSSNNIKQIGGIRVSHYGRVSPLNIIAEKFIKIGTLDLSNNPIQSDNILRDLNSQEINNNYGKIIISGEGLSEELKAKLSDPNSKLSWKLKN